MDDAPFQPYRAGKWLQIPLLASPEELDELFQLLPELDLYFVGSVRPAGKTSPSKEEFLEVYSRYVDALKNGKLPDGGDYCDYFSCALSAAQDHLALLTLPDGRELLRVQRPVIQLQEHRVDYSAHDKQFRSMVLGENSLYWGIQFSYPQLFEDPVAKQPEKVGQSDAFPNTILFRDLQRWVRHHTRPTPFLVEGKRVNVPIRLGKTCFSWINRHPQLIEQGIRVDG